MSGSDSETTHTPAPKVIPRSKARPGSSVETFTAPKDSKLDALLRAQKNKLDKERTARVEANAHRFAAMDGASKPRAGSKPQRRVPSVPCKPAYQDVPVPKTSLLLTLHGQGFGAVAVEQKALQIPRDMTHQDFLDFVEEHIPLAFEATTAAFIAWHEAHPDAEPGDVPPFFRLLAQEGKRLKVVGPTKPTGADIQAVITSASNWYDKKLFITSGIDVSMYTPDEVETWQPCLLRELLGDDAVPDPEPEDDDDASYEEPATSSKRKRASSEASEHEPEPAVTRSKRQKHASPVDLTISDDEQPKAGPSRIHDAPTLGTTTLHLTGFQSPPKRLRKRAAFGA
ncbi:hypothetical protein AURDEDRAFT_117901 [Auricularia subglabra TFB-10046 SS5]|uniref:Uncharacterized protein n=1 Tax=Auricularia subglabra (strain TFB-10046 / SS5) TaxID=717982 RepID=J0LAA0_AURST|nr:hypothetical protein AURDEDRAFT_117901 [Auricularia subglabra TFB-10046 SS5]